jgi:lipopolysaccharide biosynthesis glycosyltransferase
LARSNFEPASPKAEADEIVIAFGVDAAYVPHLATTIASVADNAPGAKLRFMIIHDGVPLAEQRKVESCAPGQAFEWPLINDSRALGFDQQNHISRATYYRFAIPELAPKSADRVIYLDSDLVVLSDIRELAATDLQGNTIGAVFDPAVDAEAFARKMDLTPGRLAYFNAGVLVLDLAKLRQSGTFEVAMDFATREANKLAYGDQCALNYVLWDKWKRLDPVWNVQRRMIAHDGRPNFATAADAQTHRRPKIVHFTEEIKPWSEGGYHPYIWTYYKHLRKTPYWRQVNSQAKNSLMVMARRWLRTSWALSRLAE